jgi:hypothetical protein
MPVGIGAAFQPWILTGERSASSTQTAVTVNGSLCRPTKSSLRPWNWKRRFVSTYCANNAGHNGSDGCKRYVVHADEKLTAFGELESVIPAQDHFH